MSNNNKCFCHLNGYEVKDAKARNSIETLNNTTSEITEDVTVLTNRMNTFTALPEGSTTADSELLDIRVGADGTVYSSAGESVRTQFNELNTKSNDLLDYVLKNYYPLTVLHATGINGFYQNGVFNNSSYIQCVKIDVSGSGIVSLNRETEQYLCPTCRRRGIESSEYDWFDDDLPF
jgi:hypothetical protein